MGCVYIHTCIYIHGYRLERSGAGKEETPAKTMLMFMVRGLCTNLEYPYVQFPCSVLKADLMYRPTTEAIYRLERLGLKVYMQPL